MVEGAAGRIAAMRTLYGLMAFLALVHSGAGEGRALVGFEDFSRWTLADEAGRATLRSPVIESPVAFDELVVSWNAAPSVRLSVEAEVKRGSEWKGPYHLGHWTGGSGSVRRTSVERKGDGFGKVSTDTLVLSGRAREVRLRLGFPGGRGHARALRFVALSLADSESEAVERRSSGRAWGRELEVPRYCQMHHPGGKVWCSPTTVAMCLSHWADVLSRPELKRSVPDTAAEVFDPGWDGTGNWTFNTAYAGSRPGMRACVARLGGITDLESLILAGIPVPASVSYGLLKGEGRKPGDGHLVVCIGFDAGGDVILNDPAIDPGVRRVYPREDFIRGWNSSVNTVYLIHPEDRRLPGDLSIPVRMHLGADR